MQLRLRQSSLPSSGADVPTGPELRWTTDFELAGGERGRADRTIKGRWVVAVVVRKLNAEIVDRGLHVGARHGP